MKRFFALILIAGLCLGICGCTAQQDAQQTPTAEPAEEPVTFFVPEPMEYPDYSFDHTPTTDELRQMAVKAMLDQINVQWSVGQFTYYQKGSGSISDKLFTFVPEMVYCGVPYTNGSSGLVQWMEFYDRETGRFTFKGTGEELDVTVGNSCAACVGSAWYAVCNSISGQFSTHVMVPSNGCLPVGPYKTNYTITSFDQYTTDQICADNTEQIMYQSYAAIQPADALVSTPDVHAIMAIEAAHVVYNEDGTINGAESTVTIADQRGGHGEAAYTYEDEKGIQFNYAGRAKYDYTFQKLLELCYIPVTTAEFMGTKEYVQPTIDFVQPGGSNLLICGRIQTNYPIRVIRAVLKDQDGNVQLIDRVLLNNTHVSKGRAYDFNTEEMNLPLSWDVVSQYMQEGKTYSLYLEVAISNGQNETVAQVDGLKK